MSRYCSDFFFSLFSVLSIFVYFLYPRACSELIHPKPDFVLFFNYYYFPSFSIHSVFIFRFDIFFLLHPTDFFFSKVIFVMFSPLHVSLMMCNRNSRFQLFDNMFLIPHFSSINIVDSTPAHCTVQYIHTYWMWYVVTFYFIIYLFIYFARLTLVKKQNRVPAQYNARFLTPQKVSKHDARHRSNVNSFNTFSTSRTSHVVAKSGEHLVALVNSKNTS